jgi:hypothetical protein
MRAESYWEQRISLKSAVQRLTLLALLDVSAFIGIRYSNPLISSPTVSPEPRELASLVSGSQVGSPSADDGVASRASQQEKAPARAMGKHTPRSPLRMSVLGTFRCGQVHMSRSLCGYAMPFLC